MFLYDNSCIKSVFIRWANLTVNKHMKRPSSLLNFQHLHFFFLLYALAWLFYLAFNCMVPPPTTPIESGMSIAFDSWLSTAFLMIERKASSTFVPFIAEVSKNGMFPFYLHQNCASSYDTCLPSLSHLLPITTKGNVLESEVPACSMKPDFHLSRASNDFFLVRSNVNTQQSAPL